MDALKSFAIGFAIIAGTAATGYFAWWAWPYSGYGLGAVLFVFWCFCIGDDIRHPVPPRLSKVRRY